MIRFCGTVLQEADNDPTGEAAANTQQTLTFYELDLGLNHVVRKYSEPLEEHGNFLITGAFLQSSFVPEVGGAPAGNLLYLSGLLVCMSIETKKRHWISYELELQTILSYHVGAYHIGFGS
jgi:hypothetical protein